MITCIKRIDIRSKNETEGIRSNEVKIAKFLSSPTLVHNSNNHCVTVIDSFHDPVRPNEHYMVMPMLRAFDEPEFGAVGEVVDFVGQILEVGIILGASCSFYSISPGNGVYPQSSHCAWVYQLSLPKLIINTLHIRDLTGPNIMMDARPIYPRGWHFADESLTPDGIDTVKPLARIDHRVRYIIIDYDNAIRFRPDESNLISRAGGLDQSAPELATRKEQPYDAFKLDVFTLGNLIYTEFLQVCVHHTVMS